MNEPKTISFSGKRLAEMKNSGEVSGEVLSELKKCAQKAASLPTLKVTER